VRHIELTEAEAKELRSFLRNMMDPDTYLGSKLADAYDFTSLRRFRIWQVIHKTEQAVKQ
jgi:hypothetical protein